MGTHAYHAVLAEDETLQAFDSPQLATLTSSDPAFSMQLSAAKLFLESTSSGQIDVKLERASGFNDPLTWPCESNNPAVTCTVSSNCGDSATEAVSSAATAHLSPDDTRLLSFASLGLALLALCGRRRRLSLPLLMVVLGVSAALCTSLLGCGTASRQTLAVVTVSAQSDGTVPRVQSQQFWR